MFEACAQKAMRSHSLAQRIRAPTLREALRFNAFNFVSATLEEVRQLVKALRNSSELELPLPRGHSWNNERRCQAWSPPA